MKVAVTIWENRISPVFDASRRLLLADLRRKGVTSRSYLVFDPEQPMQLVKMLKSQGVSVLICGAVSQIPATLIQTGGITLLPFITGEVNRVLEAYASGKPLAPTYMMPGCREITAKTSKPSH
jgi:predicted Fe-Mo cluster-binding NifX family protein